MQLELWKDVGIEFCVEIIYEIKYIAFDNTISIIFTDICGSRQ